MMDTHRRSRFAILVPIVLAAATVATLIVGMQPLDSTSSPLLDAFFITLVSMTLLPYLVIAVGLIFGRENGWVWWPALIYGAVTGVASVALNIAVLFDESSTAALAFLWLPVYQLLGMIPAAVVVILVKLAHDRRRTLRIGGHTGGMASHAE